MAWVPYRIVEREGLWDKVWACAGCVSMRSPIVDDDVFVWGKVRACSGRVH